MNSYDWACGVYHAASIKELGIPFIFTIHLPDVNCARGTMMRWGNVACDGKMLLDRCTACVCQKYGANYMLSIFLGYIPTFISKLGTRLNGRFGTAVSMKEVVNSRFHNIHKLLDISEHIVTVSNWQKQVLELNGVPEKKISFIPKGLDQKWKDFSQKYSQKCGYSNPKDWLYWANYSSKRSTHTYRKCQEFKALR